MNLLLNPRLLDDDDDATAQAHLLNLPQSDLFRNLMRTRPRNGG